MIISRSHKIRMRPTEDQKRYFFKMANAYNHAYNYAISQYNEIYDRNRDAYKKWTEIPEKDRPDKPDDEKNPHHFEIKKEYTRLKHMNESWEWVTECYSLSAAEAFVVAKRSLDRYWGIAKGKIAIPPPMMGVDGKPKWRQDKKPRGWPRFRSWKKGDISFYIANTQIKPDHLAENKIQFDKRRCGFVGLCETFRYPDAKINGARVSFDGQWWYIAISCKLKIPEPNPSLHAVGVDVGIKYLATTSEPDKPPYENKRSLRKFEKKLARLQKRLDRQRRANNPDNYNPDGTVKCGRLEWRKSKRMIETEKKINRAHNKIKNIRRDTQHKMTSDIVKDKGLIGIEDLNVRGMMKNRNLAKDIADSGFNEIHRQLEYKAEPLGCQVVKIDRWFPSSKMCSACGELNTELELLDRKWTCENCGQINERDENAAINIRDEAVRITGWANGQDELS